MRCVLIGFALLLAASAPAWPEACPGHPDAIGTARTLTVDPHVLPQIGTMQYSTSLPLDDHEVVLTFDDGLTAAALHQSHPRDSCRELRQGGLLLGRRNGQCLSARRPAN